MASPPCLAQPLAFYEGLHLVRTPAPRLAAIASAESGLLAAAGLRSRLFLPGDVGGVQELSPCGAQEGGVGWGQRQVGCGSEQARYQRSFCLAAHTL